MSKDWKRRESVPFPSTWDEFEGPKSLSKGKRPKFRIQDLTEDLVDKAIEHMKKKFLVYEPYCAFLNLTDEKKSVEEIGNMWRESCKFHCALIALLDNPKEMKDKKLPLIAGCNMMYPKFPVEKTEEAKNGKIRSVLNLLDQVSNKVDCFKKYNVSVILTDMGLSVDPVYKGQGLGERLLRARIPLCKALGITLTTAVFTAKESLYLARKIGYEIVADLDSDTYQENGVTIFKGVVPQIIQYMAVKIK